MSEYKIWGGRALEGTVAVSGAKNGALPLLFASVLTEEDCTFYHLPDIGDVRLTVELLTRMGASAVWLDAHTLRLNTAALDPTAVQTELTSRLRASSYLLGACLGRFGMCPALPTGGCDFGNRPLDCHYEAFHALGAEGDAELSSPRGLHPAIYTFPRVSVGATVNALLASARVPGESVFYGCAVESHVTALARFLICLGADIRGVGTPCLRIRGNPDPGGGMFVVPPDDIEAGTYLCAAAACGGDVTLTQVQPAVLSSVIAVLKDMGCETETGQDTLRLKRKGLLRGVSVETAPAPGFPTDLHPPLAAAMCFASTPGEVRERVWAQRFRYVEELRRMGADMTVAGDTLRVHPSALHAAAVTATDLRGGAALVVAALAARGRSVISARELLERGYESLPRKLRALGAEIL